MSRKAMYVVECVVYQMRPQRLSNASTHQRPTNTTAAKHTCMTFLLFQKVCSNNYSSRASAATKIGSFNDTGMYTLSSASGEFSVDVIHPTSVKKIHGSLKATPSFISFGVLHRSV